MEEEKCMKTDIKGLVKRQEIMITRSLIQIIIWKYHRFGTRDHFCLVL